MSTLAELRATNMREQQADSEASVDTELRNSASAEARTDASPQAIADLRKPMRTAVRKQALTDGRADVLPSVLPQARTDFLTSVRESLDAGRNPAGGVKATVDMSPELSTRAKRYSLDHANVPVRRVLIELLDAFLSEEGY